jgi:hypothetical protein
VRSAISTRNDIHLPPHLEVGREYDYFTAAYHIDCKPSRRWQVGMIAMYKAMLFINHDKKQEDKLRLLPAFYD